MVCKEKEYALVQVKEVVYTKIHRLLEDLPYYTLKAMAYATLCALSAPCRDARCRHDQGMILSEYSGCGSLKGGASKRRDWFLTSKMRGTEPWCETEYEPESKVCIDTLLSLYILCSALL